MLELKKRKSKSMSNEFDSGFSGFMPMIGQVNVSEAIQMLSTEGDLVKAHTIRITTKEGNEYVFSIDPSDLMRLTFLLLRIAGND